MGVPGRDRGDPDRGGDRLLLVPEKGERGRAARPLPRRRRSGACAGRGTGVIHLRVYGASVSLTDLGRALGDDGGARNVALARGVRPGHVLLTAEVAPGQA